MRNFAVLILVIVLSWAQFMFPAMLAPWQIVPDFLLLFVVALSLYYEPRHVVLWWALLGGLLIDIWQPSRFGVWTILSLLVALVTMTFQTRVLPKLSWPGIYLTSFISVSLALIIMFLIEWWQSHLSLGSASLIFLRIYGGHLVLDMILLGPVVYFVHRILFWLKPYQTPSRMTPQTS